MRRFSGFNSFDISDELDFIVSNSFSEAKAFLEASGKNIDINCLTKWNAYVDRLLGNLFLVNHVDISAPGTAILAYYSSQQALVPRSMWSMRLPDALAKVFTIWLNSSLNLLQLLLMRRETRGAYIWFVASTIKKFRIPDIKKIPKADVEKLLHIFDKHRRTKFFSIINQLKDKVPARVEIDRVVLKVLGFSEEESNQLLNYLYPALTKEIKQLKTLMQG